ncbi:hypothetical protein FXF51_55170 [Nonomuraea sp. PA05]|uniref:hypothetical protein n=1 Tax=Nonomuraea sp. PA05 TaxID=2604466 RepID=UPI0011D3B941|nr:hypothetical protein [Nonomuraea sp. PA05]TYB50759.1 hypothetical protein FXF51_55170 [Nonomuraea sp. PA05]
MKRRLSGTRAPLRRSKRAKSEPIRYEPGSSLVATKKPKPKPNKSLIEADPKITKVLPKAGNWSKIKFVAGHQPLPAGAKVSLAPEPEMEGTPGSRWIKTLLVSGLQRTPSPFRNRMGDHTTAWQAVVDSVKAAVHEKPIKEAAAAILAMQAAAETSLKASDGSNRLLFTWMEQIDAESATDRLPRMQDAAQTVAEACDQATKAKNESDAAAALSKAIAHHLAFLNYLPFSTVPAASDRGSTGSGEGTHHAALLTYEIAAAEALKAKKKPVAALAEGATAAVWGMFAFDAVLREAQIDYALNPAAAMQVAKQHGQLVAINAKINQALKAVVNNAGKPAQQDVMEEALAELDAIIATEGVYRDVLLAAGHLKAKVTDVRERLSEPYQLDRAKQALKLQTSPATQGHLDKAKRVAGDVTKLGDGNQAASLAIDVLANLLHKHVRTMAATYPHSVAALKLGLPPSGKLGAKAAEQLAGMVEEGLRKHYPDYFADATEPSRLQPLLKQITAQLAAMPTIAVKPEITTWASAAQRADLVVTVKAKEKEKLKINGRAPAPPGVAGMGCHTTAWVMETQHVNYLVREARTDKEIIAKLQAAVTRDLNAKPIGLAHLLPIDQIRGRQLTSLFDQAAAVLKAESASQAATAYLSFRNLLPYATVDEGDRSGKRERKDGTLDETYDKAAIEQAGNRVKEELKNAGLDVIASLRDEDDLLRQQSAQWDFNPVLAAAVEATRTRLTDLADGLGNTQSAARNKLGDQGRSLVLNTRRDEHKKVWTEAKVFRDGK